MIALLGKVVWPIRRITEIYKFREYSKRIEGRQVAQLNLLATPFHGLSFESQIDDQDAKKLIRTMCYMGRDLRAAWIGGGIPRTNCEEFEPIANWARQHWAMYWAFVAEFVVAEPQSSKTEILDIGCGVGNMSMNLASVLPDYSVVGLDLNPNVTAFANRVKNQDNLYIGSEDAFDTKNKNRFKYIFALEILEHLHANQHVEFVDLMLEALTPDGLLFISTPNAKHEKDEPFGHIGLLNSERAKEFFKRYQSSITHFSYYNNESLESADIERFIVRQEFDCHLKDDINRSHFRVVLKKP